MSAILAEFPMPDAVIGTRAAEGQVEWCRDGNRSLDHEQWAIRTQGKRSGGRDPTYTISFSAVVDLGGVTLAHDKCLSDVLTRKLVCLAVLNNACRRRFKAAGLSRLCLAFDWHIRHRLSLGVERNAGLTPEHFSDYVKQLRDHGVTYLVPIEKRIRDFSERDRAARNCAGPDLRPKLGLDRVARELGVTANAPELRALLVGALNTRMDWATVPVEETARRRKATARRAGRSARAMRQSLEPWIVLADLTQQGLLEHDPLSFDPFADQRESAALLADRNGTNNSRVTIAPPYFLKLMSAAATWVTEYSGAILKAVAHAGRPCVARRR